MAKIEMSEVIALCQEFQTAAENVKDSLEKINGNATDISSLNSFTGDGPSKAKNYLKDIYKGVNEAYNETLEIITDSFDVAISNFESSVDEASDTLIQDEYLETVRTEVEKSSKLVKNATKTINASIGSISDISNASKVNTSEISKSSKEFNQIIEKLKKSLSSFISSSQSIAADCDNAIEYLGKIQAEMNKITSNGGISGYKASTITTVMGLLKENKKLNKARKHSLKLVAAVNSARGYKKLKASGDIFYNTRNIKNATKVWIIDPNTGKKVLASSARRSIPGSVGFNKKGKEFLKNKELQFDKYQLKRTKLSGIGRASKDGVKDSFKLVDVSGIKNSFKSGSWIKGTGKVLGGGLSVGFTALSAYDNYTDAKKQGLNKKEAVVASGINTATSMAVYGASAKVGMAIGTAIFPGAGTVVGAVLGLATGMIISGVANKVLDKVLLDPLKKGVNKTVKEVGKKVKQLGNNVSSFFGKAKIGNFSFG